MTANTDDTSSTSPYKPGDIFGDYCLQEKLGRITFKAIRETEQKIVAIKIFHKSLENARQLYETEVKALDLTKDIPGVLPLFDEDQFNGDYCIATEFVHSGTLRDEIQRHPGGMSIEDVLLIFTFIANTIDQIHERNIIHRDLKPENILLRKTNSGYESFIADFGIVKFVDKSKSYNTENIYGTPGYISPEGWLLSERQTTANDIFSFGVMLYESFEGKPPFEQDALIPAYPIPYPGRTKANTRSEGIVDLLLWTLSEDQNKRPRTAKEVIELMAKINSAEDFERKWIGRKFRDYVVEEVLGEEGGKPNLALRAKDVSNSEQQVVLKAFQQNTKRIKQAYEEELRSMRRIEAGNGVLIHINYFIEDGIFFIVTEYQSGGSLRNLFEEKKSRLEAKEFLEIFAQIAKAIDYIHSKGIIHRDIKPENIVYKRVGEKIIPSVTDFDIAKVLDGTESAFYTNSLSGTYRYMAPESFQPNTKQTKKIDIYAFGVMIYEALEGHVPFEAKSRDEAMRHLEEPVPQMKYISENLGLGAADALSKALSKSVSERPKSAGRLVNSILKPPTTRRSNKKRTPTVWGQIKTGLKKPITASGLLLLIVFLCSYLWFFPNPLQSILFPSFTATPTYTRTISSPSPTNTYTPAATETATPTLTNIPIMARINKNSNCRSNPNSAEIIGVILQGTYVTILGKNSEQGEWLLIMGNDSTGKSRQCWIIANSFDLDSPISLVPIASVFSTSSPASTYTPTPTVRGNSGNNNQATNTIVPNPSATTDTPKPPTNTPKPTDTPKPPTNTPKPTNTACEPLNNKNKCPTPTP